jgi:hypothetical protein
MGVTRQPRARRLLAVEETADDRGEIQDDIKHEQALDKELGELEEQGKRLEKERARRLALLKGEPLPPEEAE